MNLIATAATGDALEDTFALGSGDVIENHDGTIDEVRRRPSDG